MTIESKAIVDRKLLSGTSTNYGLFVIFLDECLDFTYIRARADFYYAFSKTESMLTVEERIAIVLEPLLAKLLPYKKFQSVKSHAEPNECAIGCGECRNVRRKHRSWKKKNLSRSVRGHRRKSRYFSPVSVFMNRAESCSFRSASMVTCSWRARRTS